MENGVELQTTLSKGAPGDERETRFLEFPRRSPPTRIGYFGRTEGESASKRRQH